MPTCSHSKVRDVGGRGVMKGVTCCNMGYNMLQIGIIRDSGVTRCGIGVIRCYRCIRCNIVNNIYIIPYRGVKGGD